ncbi:MAG: hypothetical protein KC996_11240 [Phycisphaerales bacterium]|nr:hypothetical protein [Phycisphaerales bacterium]
MNPRLLHILILLALLSRASLGAAVRPATDRIDAVVGQPIVLRLIVDEEAKLRQGLTIKLDDARSIECPLFWVGAEPDPAVWTSWTSPPLTTRALSAREATIIPLDRRPIGGWYTRIDIPIDAVGQGIWIDGERSELNWLPDPERTRLESRTSEFDRFFEPALTEEQRNSPPVQDAIEHLASSPFTRWHARVILDGLDPSERFVPMLAPREEGYLSELENEVLNTSEGELFLETLAHQREIRWQIILGRIWLIDPALAERLKESLTRVVRFEGTLLPFWSSDQSALDELAHDLLSPWVDDELRAKRARAWLDAQPRAAVWVIDDLGALQPETQKFTPTLGIVSMPPEHGQSLVRLDAKGAQTVLETVGDSSMHKLTLSTPIGETVKGQTIVPVQEIRARIGYAEMTRPSVSAPIEARPPGVRLGPMHRDWTMQSLIIKDPSADAAAPLARSTAGMLYRTASPDERDARIGWSVYTECASVDPTNAEDTLTLWIGPYSAPLAAWTINAEGRVALLGGSMLSVGIPTVHVVTQEDRWTAQIELPPDAIPDDLLLAIGIERRDGGGFHSAWPRRMFPGQHEPARLLVDLSTWDGFRRLP